MSCSIKNEKDWIKIINFFMLKRRSRARICQVVYCMMKNVGFDNMDIFMGRECLQIAREWVLMG